MKLFRPAQELCNTLKDLPMDVFRDKLNVFLYVKELFEKRIDFIPSIINDKITKESSLDSMSLVMNESVSELDDSLNSNLNDSIAISSETTATTNETTVTPNETKTTNETNTTNEKNTTNETNENYTTNESTDTPIVLDIYASDSNMEVQEATLPSCSNLDNEALVSTKKILRVKKSNNSSPSKLKSNLRYS